MGSRSFPQRIPPSAVRQLAGVLPRWVPIAVIGVVLLVVGATYEARLRDLGRIRTALGGMR